MDLMYPKMGLAVLDGLSAHSAADHQATMARIQQKYENAMAAISAAQQSNAQTHNEIGVRDAMVQERMQLGIAALQQEADAESSAAAAGVAGGSVRSTLRGLMRSSLQARRAHNERLKQQAMSNRNNRRQIAMSAVMWKNNDIIMRPSPASALLGIGASLVDIYDEFNPEGSRSTDALAGL